MQFLLEPIKRKYPSIFPSCLLLCHTEGQNALLAQPCTTPCMWVTVLWLWAGNPMLMHVCFRAEKSQGRCEINAYVQKVLCVPEERQELKHVSWGLGGEGPQCPTLSGERTAPAALLLSLPLSSDTETGNGITNWWVCWGVAGIQTLCSYLARISICVLMCVYRGRFSQSWGPRT